jgi:hypothetical protein
MALPLFADHHGIESSNSSANVLSAVGSVGDAAIGNSSRGFRIRMQSTVLPPNMVVPGYNSMRAPVQLLVSSSPMMSATES